MQDSEEKVKTIFSYIEVVPTYPFHHAWIAACAEAFLKTVPAQSKRDWHVTSTLVCCGKLPSVEPRRPISCIVAYLPEDYVDDDDGPLVGSLLSLGKIYEYPPIIVATPTCVDFAVDGMHSPEQLAKRIKRERQEMNLFCLKKRCDLCCGLM